MASPIKAPQAREYKIFTNFLNISTFKHFLKEIRTIAATKPNADKQKPVKNP